MEKGVIILGKYGSGGESGVNMGFKVNIRGSRREGREEGVVMVSWCCMNVSASVPRVLHEV